MMQVDLLVPTILVQGLMKLVDLPVPTILVQQLTKE
jgi:hypothetical protein